MSLLLDKSIDNEQAFALLKEHKLYAPCVHCGYYSCFQKIVHILKEFFKDEYDQIVKDIEGRQKGSLHGQCIKEFVYQIKVNFGKKEAHELKNNLKNLKSLRIEADYDEIEIDEQKVVNVKRCVDSVHSIIKRHFKNLR